LLDSATVEIVGLVTEYGQELGVPYAVNGYRYWPVSD
jgi:hypothetical protein